MWRGAQSGEYSGAVATVLAILQRQAWRQEPTTVEKRRLQNHLRSSLGLSLPGDPSAGTSGPSLRSCLAILAGNKESVFSANVNYELTKHNPSGKLLIHVLELFGNISILL